MSELKVLKYGDVFYHPALNYLHLADDNFNKCSYDNFENHNTNEHKKYIINSNPDSDRISNFKNNWKEFIVIDVEYVEEESGIENPNKGYYPEYWIIKCCPVLSKGDIVIQFIQEVHGIRFGGPHSGSIENVQIIEFSINVLKWRIN